MEPKGITFKGEEQIDALEHILSAIHCDSRWDSQVQLYEVTIQLNTQYLDIASGLYGDLMEQKKTAYNSSKSKGEIDLFNAFRFHGNKLDEYELYELSLAAFEEAIEIIPDNHEVWIDKGNALYYLGRFKEALEAYEKAIELKPDNPEVWKDKANVLFELGREDESSKAYEKAAELQGKEQ